MEFPYQLVTFLGAEPKVDEPIYDGPNSWYPQVALKRRFGLATGMTEAKLLGRLAQYAAATKAFNLHLLQVTQPERMLVEVIGIQPDEAVMGFHRSFITAMGSDIVSRYPDREGDNYYPHVTL